MSYANVFDQIATVTVGIQTAVTSEASFDKILIIGPLPKVAPAKAPDKVGYYTNISEVTAAGWVASSTTASEIDPVGAAALAAFSQDPKPEGIYIAPIQTVTTGTGDDAVTTAESAAQTMERALETSGWYVVCPAGVSDEVAQGATTSDLDVLAAFVETQEKMMIYNEAKFFGAGTNGADKPSIGTTYARTAGVYCKETSDQAIADVPAVNRYGMNAAFAAAWLAYQSGSETAAYKVLKTVAVAKLSGTERNALENANINFFQKVGNRNVTMFGKVLADEWMDIIRFRDWLKNDMQVRIVNLFLINPKIPFTDAGIALVRNAVFCSLKAGETNGGIARSEYNADGDEIPGFEINVPLAVDIPDSDKQARVLNGITWKARLAGAIHVAHITGTLAYSI